MSNLNPETYILIACSFSQLKNERLKIIQTLLTQTLDWDLLIKSAKYHKVVPYLHKTLTTHFHKKIPARILSDLQEIVWYNSIHSLNVSAALVNIINIFDENGIDILPIKGPLLAERLYGSCSMRMYGDLDILVRQKDLEKALNVLQKNNYKLIPDGIPQSTYMKFLRYKYHGQLVDNNGVIIELHWELTGFYVSELITFENLERFLIRTKFSNCSTFDLSNEMLFIYLCIHGNSHRFEKLDYICSIAQLLHVAPNVDWTLILAICSKYKMTNRVIISIYLARALFDSTIPEIINNSISNNWLIRNLADKVLERDIYHTNTDELKHPLQRNAHFQFSVMDSKYESGKYLLRSIVVPNHNDWNKSVLYDILFGLYFVNKTYRMLSVPLINRINEILR